jgi:LuxR family maltose regulon positive regulatory protein
MDLCPCPSLRRSFSFHHPRPGSVLRPRLIERLNDGLRGKLTLLSAPAGFGKTRLAGEWVTGFQKLAAWLSLDEADNDPARFLTYFVAALQGISANIGEGVSAALQSPQPPPVESMLTLLLNDLAAIPRISYSSSTTTTQSTRRRSMRPSPFCSIIFRRGCTW